MFFRSRVLISLNKLFKAPVHPFNLNNQGEMTYAMWQYRNGQKTIDFFLQRFTRDELFKDKVVLDIGCGAAGKSLFYASCGAAMVYGIEILDKYRAEAMELAVSLGLAEHFTFVNADSAKLPLEDNFADTVIMNDAMEHVGDPNGTILEMLRVLKPGGRIFINFPPYYHPSGAHLTDAVYIPWVHLLFPDKVLIESYKYLVKDLPDGSQRIEFRISQDINGSEYFSYINKMTLARFRRLVSELSIDPVFYNEVPLRGFLSPLAKLPLLKEMFVKMAVCVVEKPAQI